MKITKEHIEVLKTAILPLCTKEVIEQYENGQFARAELVKDLQKRFCIDMLYTAMIGGETATKWVCDNIYPYADDTHLYSALKSFMPVVTKKY